jgi:integrase
LRHSLAHQGLLHPFRPDGKPLRRYFYANTRSQAVEKMQKAIREFRDGLPVVGDKQTVGEFLQSWLTTTAEPRLKPRTFADYKLIVEKHLVPALGRHKLRQLTPPHVQALIAAKSQTLAPRRVAIIRAVLRAALNDAAKWSLVSRNVATLVTLPRAPRFCPKVLPPSEAKRLVKVASKHRLGALCSVAMAAGLRLGEALALAWQGLDLKQGRLSVRRTLQQRMNALLSA